MPDEIQGRPLKCSRRMGCCRFDGHLAKDRSHELGRLSDEDAPATDGVLHVLVLGRGRAEVARPA